MKDKVEAAIAALISARSWAGRLEQSLKEATVAVAGAIAAAPGTLDIDHPLHKLLESIPLGDVQQISPVVDQLGRAAIAYRDKSWPAQQAADEEPPV